MPLLLHRHAVAPRVYIETTIPSFYYETRPQPEMIARRNWTQAWWDGERHKYELVTSDAVVVELALAVPHKGEKVMGLVMHLPRLDESLDVRLLAQHYVEQKVMPQNLGGDAMHLALATWYRCDFL